MSLAENVDVVHEELIEQEGIKVSDLPKNVQSKIKGWKLLYAKLKKSEDEGLFRSVQRKSIEIADKIQDYIESDYEDEETEEVKSEPKAEEKKEEKKSEPKAEEKKSDAGETKTETKTTKVSSDKSNFGNLVMEKKVLSQIKENKNNRIRINQLQSIIGKVPDYPEQKVNKITLRKVFMSSEYRLK